MTVPRRLYGPNPPGRLPAAMLRALAAELADPGRFARAKQYARDGAVVDIEVDAGAVRAVVQGSRYEPYHVELHVAPTDDAASLLGLVPDRDEVVASCSCPDDAWGGFCKHALAAMLVLADEVTAEPEVLTRWRDGGDGPFAGRVAGAPADTAAIPVIEVLGPMLRAPAPLPEVVPLPRRLPVPVAGGQHGDELAAVLADALSVLRSR